MLITIKRRCLSAVAAAIIMCSFVVPGLVSQAHAQSPMYICENASIFNPTGPTTFSTPHGATIEVLPLPGAPPFTAGGYVYTNAAGFDVLATYGWKTRITLPNQSDSVDVVAANLGGVDIQVDFFDSVGGVVTTDWIVAYNPLAPYFSAGAEHTRVELTHYGAEPEINKICYFH